MVKLWLTSASLEPALAPLAEVTVLPETPPARRRTLFATRVAEGPSPDGLIITPKRWPDRSPPGPDLTRLKPQPTTRDLLALTDDGAWDALVEQGLKDPWFWLIAGLAALERQRHGAIVLVVPRRVPGPFEGPDEAMLRATLRGFVRATSERAKPSSVRINAVELAGPALDAEGAELVLAVVKTRGFRGEVLGGR